jgi:hypothetical protein
MTSWSFLTNHPGRRYASPAAGRPAARLISGVRPSYVRNLNLAIFF